MSNQRDYYRNSKDPEQKKSGFLSILVRYVIPYLIINSIILFFVLATPKLKVNEITETEDPTVRTLLVHVDSILPIKEFTAKLEGKEQNFTKENQNYIISITGNGNLRISAKFDENPPVIDEDNVILGSGYVEFTVTDEQSGVDFATIYGIDKDGDNLKPTDIEESSGKVTFSMKSNGLTVYVSDKAGNQITGNFTLEESPFPKTKEDEKEDEKEDNKESSSHSSSKNSSSSKDEEESSSSKSSSKNTSSQSSGKSSSRKSSSQTSTNSGSGKSKSN